MILKDKLAVITGGAGGIGNVIVKKFIKEGATVVVLDKTPSQTAGVASYKADVSDYDNIKKIFINIIKKYKHIDILVNCAGIQAPIGPFVENKLSDWERNIKINLLGTVAASSMALPHMIKRRSGAIINFAGGGATSSRPNLSAYSVSKTGIVRFTEVVADEVRKYGVRINAVSPGAVNTAMTYEILKIGKKAGKKELEDVKNRLENGGASPELAADLVTLLASDKTKKMSGKLISAVWDNWDRWDSKKIEKIAKSDLYVLRRTK